MMNRRSLRGFTLTEMLVILGLMGVAALLCARLFTGSMRVIGDAPRAQKQVSQFEHMTRALECDVWNAMSISTEDGATIKLEQADGSQVQWSFGEVEVVRTTSRDAAPQRWVMNLPLRGRRDGVWLVLESGNSAPGVERRFVSQMMSVRPL